MFISVNLKTTKEKEIRRSTGQIDGTRHIRPPPAKALEGQRERPIQLASAEKSSKICTDIGVKNRPNPNRS